MSSEVQRYCEVCKGSKITHCRCPLQSITTASSTCRRIPTVRHPPDHKESSSITYKASTDSQQDRQRPNDKQTLRCNI